MINERGEARCSPCSTQRRAKSNINRGLSPIVPTAIATTLAGLRHKVGSARIIAVLEPRSNTMRMGVHKETLLPSLEGADKVFIFTPPDLGWSLPAGAPPSVTTCSDFDLLLQSVLAEVQPGDHLLVMSNGGFNGIHGKLLKGL